MGSTIDMYFGVAAIVGGIYCLYQAFLMNKTGVICKSLLLDRETALKKCKDIGAFLSKVIMPTVVIGITILIYGIVTLVDVYVVECDIAVYILMAITVVILGWFAIVTKKAKEEFF